MLSLLLLIFISVTIVFFKISYKKDSSLMLLCGTIGFAMTALLVCFMVLCINSALTDRYIDKKIDMYESENEEIENQINILVKNYMKFEHDTYTEIGTISGAGSISLVSLYPELKSDELVKEQINLYLENSNTIKKLKNEKLEITKCKWWLYFG